MNFPEPIPRCFCHELCGGVCIHCDEKLQLEHDAKIKELTEQLAVALKDAQQWEANFEVLTEYLAKANLRLYEARFLAKTWNRFRPHSDEIHPFFANYDRKELRKAEEIAAKCDWLEETE